MPAASLTSAHSPSGVTSAISGLWKLCRTAVVRSAGQERIVTVPAAGLQTTTGPVGPAASVVGSPATETRRSTRPVNGDTSSTACSVSEVTTASGTPSDGGCTVVAAELAMFGGAAVVPRVDGGAVAVDPAEVLAADEQPDTRVARSRASNSFMALLRLSPRFASRGTQTRLHVRTMDMRMAARSDAELGFSRGEGESKRRRRVVRTPLAGRVAIGLGRHRTTRTGRRCRPGRVRTSLRRTNAVRPSLGLLRPGCIGSSSTGRLTYCAASVDWSASSGQS